MTRLLLVFFVLGVLAGAGYYYYAVLLTKNKPIPATVGIAPVKQRDAIPVPATPFKDVTALANLKFKHQNGATGRKLLPETMGSGVAILDYDNDGWQDIFLVNSCSWPGAKPNPEKMPTSELYRNKRDGTFERVTKQVGLDESFYGMGACVGDFNNDGFPDLFVTGIGGNRLYENTGEGSSRKFKDVTTEAGLALTTGWPSHLSESAFYEHAQHIPFGSSATFVDYDGDGLLDLFVCYYVSWSPAIDLSIASSLTGIGRSYQQPTSLEGSKCTLYRNLGNGKFADVSRETGIIVEEKEGIGTSARTRLVGKSLGVIVLDADQDGWPDLIVANDTVRNFFFHNVPDGSGGRRFEEIGVTANIAYAEGTARGAMGIDYAEYQPGKSALLIANFANEPNSFLILNNSRRLLFADASSAVGLLGPSRAPLKFGAFFFDYDLDGRLDLLTCNGHIEPEIAKVQPGQQFEQPPQLFWNSGQAGRVFEPVNAQSTGEDLFRPLVGRGSAYLDFDLDGDLDLILTENNGPARLLRNDQKLGHHWLRLTLVGDGKQSNRSAIGAEVTLEAEGLTLKRSISGAKGYLSQSELPLTFGLGKLTKIDKVIVRWPGRGTDLVQTFTGLEVDRKYQLVQGEIQAVPMK